ncbi:unnamed protein product [Closterium sp. Naga37s-1]|nr:unnamed protein product [Closterium sp. Naga37s-1]
MPYLVQLASCPLILAAFYAVSLAAATNASHRHCILASLRSLTHLLPALPHLPIPSPLSICPYTPGTSPPQSSFQITCRFSSGSGIGKNPSPGSKPGKRPSSSSSSSSSPTPSSSSPQQAKASLPLPLASFPWAPLLSSILARFHSLLSVSFSLLLLPYLLSSSLGELAFALRQQQVLLAGAAALAACLGCYWLMERVGKELGGLVKEGGAVGKVLALVVQNSTNLMMVVAVICALLKAAGPSLPPVLRVILCQTSPASSATRQFVQRNYADLKQQNPHLPILIRECSGVQPRITARYGKREYGGDEGGGGRGEWGGDRGEEGGGRGGRGGSMGMMVDSMRLVRADVLDSPCHFHLSLLIPASPVHASHTAFLCADYGVEHSMALEGLSEEQIDGKLKELLDLGKLAAADAAAAKQ